MSPGSGPALVLTRRLLPAVPWKQWIVVLVTVGLIGQHTIDLWPDFAR